MPSCCSDSTAGPLSCPSINCYSVLDLYHRNFQVSAVGQAEIKQAYRRALLSNHPDKSRAADLTHRDQAQYTIDEVSRAYHTLIDPKRRHEHDRQLRLEPRARTDNDDPQSHPGIETRGLDEFNHEVSSGGWYRGCRCGDQKGFTLTEGELQTTSLSGDFIMECRGCSLRLRVTFAKADDGT